MSYTQDRIIFIHFVFYLFHSESFLPRGSILCNRLLKWWFPKHYNLNHFSYVLGIISFSNPLYSVALKPWIIIPRGKPNSSFTIPKNRWKQPSWRVWTKSILFEQVVASELNISIFNVDFYCRFSYDVFCVTWRTQYT